MRLQALALLVALFSVPSAAPALAAKKAAPAKKAPAKKAPAKKAPAKNAAAAKGAASPAKGYLDAHGFEARTVEINLPGRKVTRTFVPVTQETREDFVDRFGEKNNGVILRHSGDLEHPVIVFANNKGLNHEGVYVAGEARFNKKPFDYGWGQPLGNQGQFITMQLGAPNLKALEKHWQTTQEPPNAKSGCMWWLVHAEVDKRKPLAHALGITRAGATSNLIKKMMHAGNERVGVIGVAVPNLEAFNQLTDQQLLGTPPGGGAMEAVRD